MKNESNWKPSKFVKQGGRWRANSDRQEVAVSSRHHVNLVVEALEIELAAHCRGSLLDLGCGKVPLYGIYRSHASSIVCADWSSSLHDLSHVDITADLQAPLPFPDARFDTILLTDVLEHIPTPELLMDEVSRVLTPRGKLIGSVPFMYRLHEEPHDYYRYTSHALSRMARKCGLEVTVLRNYGGGLDVISDLAAKLLVDVHWRIGPILSSLVQRFIASVRKSAVGSRYTVKRSDIPMGYVFVFSKI